MDTYRIIISGDSDRAGTMALTDEEIRVFRKIVDKLEPWGDYAPVVTIENLSNQEKRRKEAEQRKAEKERRKAK